MSERGRIGLLESLLDTFPTRAREGGYIILEVLGLPDEFVQFRMHSGRVSGEVGSRQWSEPERRLGGPDLPLEAGIHRELLDRFTEQVVCGTLDSWSSLATPPELGGPAPTPRRRCRRPRTDG